MQSADYTGFTVCPWGPTFLVATPAWLSGRCQPGFCLARRNSKDCPRRAIHGRRAKQIALTDTNVVEKLNTAQAGNSDELFFYFYDLIAITPMSRDTCVNVVLMRRRQFGTAHALNRLNLGSYICRNV